MSKYKATVRWFDSLRGEGMIRLPDGTSVFFERSVVLPEADKYVYGDRQTDFLDTHVYAGQEVYVRVHEDSHYRQIDWFLPADPKECWNYLEAL